MNFRKLPPKIIRYRDFKKILSELQSVISHYNNRNFEANPDSFFQVFIDALDIHAPPKKNICVVTANLL